MTKQLGGDPQGAVAPEQPVSEQTLVWPIKKVRPNPDQPRQTKTKRFAQKLQELKDSIETVGQLHPIVVTAPDEDGVVTIIDGERRWTAITQLTKEGKLKGGTIEVVLRNVGDPRDLFIMSLAANCCRQDMSEMDQARSIERLQQDNYPVEQIAKFMGKSTGWVYNMLKYLALHPKVAQLLDDGEISASTALNLASYPQASQLAILRDVRAEQKAKGKPLTAQEIGLTVARSSDQRGIEAKLTKKGKTALAYSPKLVNQAIKAAERLRILLQSVDDRVLAEAGDDRNNDLFLKLKALEEVMDPVKDKIDATR